MRFLIIGGDAAGMSAASRAKRKNPDLEVIVLEKTRDVSYSACGMPYNIADPERDMDELVVRRAEVFIEKNNINLLIGHRAERINTGSKTVSGDTLDGRPFSFSYDFLLIATGAAPVMPDLPGFDLPGVMPLKNLEHGRAIKDFITKNKVKKAVILGMGYIGLEMCEALRERAIEVDMVKPRKPFLPWLVPALSEVVYNEVVQNNVRLYAGSSVKKIISTDRGLSLECDNITLETDMVIAASGVTPCSKIASEAGLETGVSNAIAVDFQLRTSDKTIYAAGDCADAVHVVTGKKCWIPLALRANRAGWAVADNVCGTETRLDGVAGTSVFRVFSLEVARTGLNMKEAEENGFDPVENTIKTRSRAHAHPGSTTIYVSMVGDRTTGRLIGVQMVGQEGVAHRINAPAVALHSKMSVQAFAQCDLAYAPPFSPVWDPMLTAANQLLKKI
ncbi:MAG: FAD-dependent oxidoreductase [Thermodesulfobacteriota bacterium]|nr:FAD-dependent oxidoreductase [Thermodesulfobacteriota bacterium]